MIKVEGEPNTFVNSTMEAEIKEDTGYLEISKGFMSLVMSELQTEELRKMLNRNYKKRKSEVRNR
jgi:hypothetical protein